MFTTVYLKRLFTCFVLKSILSKMDLSGLRSALFSQVVTARQKKQCPARLALTGLSSSMSRKSSRTNFKLNNSIFLILYSTFIKLACTPGKSHDPTNASTYVYEKSC